MTRAAPTDSAWRLRADLTTAKLLIWAASVGRDATLTPETHLFLADRYDRLAHIYRMRGRHAKARGLSPLAAEHYRAGGWNGPVCRSDGDATPGGLGAPERRRPSGIEDLECRRRVSPPGTISRAAL